MIELIAFAAASVAGVTGYRKSRDFVQHRLRYVDDVQKPAAPLVAAGVATAIALPVVALLPVIAGGTALVFGTAVGLGTRAGVRRIRQAQ
ncbi:MAG TPA: hypothetical protein VK929_08210 [Longimicrobiales bacterium]|nr:hypothetical protein [Longimicrobiales bacterium]